MKNQCLFDEMMNGSRFDELFSGITPHHTRQLLLVCIHVVHLMSFNYNELRRDPIFLNCLLVNENGLRPGGSDGDHVLCVKKIRV